MGSAAHVIVLDTTLRDLYSVDETTEQDIVLVYAIPTARVQMTPWIPLSTKFVYQAPLAETEGSDVLARRCLQVIPQLFGFIAGKMPLILFDIDENDSTCASLGAYRADGLQTFDQLAPSQQPELSFVTKPESILLRPGAKIAVSNPMDCLLHLPHTVDPEVHYALHSKKDLSFSGLPTPESQVIETKLHPNQMHDESVLNDEVARMMRPVIERTPPFVVKVPQSLSGYGTFIVRTEADQQEAIEVLTTEVKRLLKQINDSNMHMQPSCIILQNMVPGETYSLPFFVTRSGKAVLTSCCKQRSKPSGQWRGSFISYKQQDHLQCQYAGIVEKLTNFVHDKGYYGPMGVDVMTDHDGRQVIVDMNIRVTGSHTLGFLKNHFLKRSLHEAVVIFPFLLRCTRDKFHQMFSKEFSDGSLIIIGWCHDKEGKTSMATIILAAEDSDSLSQFIERVDVHRITED